jgi:autotransporter-associated beta strand protein
MKPHRDRFLPLSLIGSSLALFTSGHLQAETQYTWQGGASTDWTNSANWQSSSIAPTGTTADVRLRALNGAGNRLIYSSAQGNTTYANTTGNGGANPSYRGLVIASSNTAGSMEITGGSFSTVGSLSADNIGSIQNGTLTVSGGSYTGTSAGTVLGQNSSGGISTLTVGGTGTATVAVLQMSGATAIVNLNLGGTLTANQLVDADNVAATGNSNTIFNFNGGTLKAGSGAATAFMTGLTNAYVLSNGAKIDTNGKDITIGQALLDFTTPSGGGLTKSGSGTLILSNSNTYTGNTVVNDGMLTVSSTGGLRFVPTTSGATNSVSGTGTATLWFLGTVGLDLTSANTTSGNTWNLVNLASFSGPAPTLTPSAVTSNLGSFSLTSPGVWELSVTGAIWSFNEADGTLAYVTTGTDYDTWGAPYGLSVGSEGADPDGDGLTNQQEYAFGLIPNSGASVNPITVQLDKSLGTFTYQRRNPSLTGLTSYKILTSTDLVTWTQDATAGQVATAIPASDNQSVVVTLTTPPTSTKFFVRVSAE